MCRSHKLTTLNGRLRDIRSLLRLKRFLITLTKFTSKSFTFWLLEKKNISGQNCFSVKSCEVRNENEAHCLTGDKESWVGTRKKTWNFIWKHKKSKQVERNTDNGQPGDELYINLRVSSSLLLVV